MDDARFVRDVLIEEAINAGRWNLVVFEAYRTAELLIKGIIYSVGNPPDRHHRLHHLIKCFSKTLEENRQAFPFIYKAIDSNGHYYHVRFVGETVQLLKHMAGTYTQLGSLVRLQNPYLPLGLTRCGTTVSIVQGETRLLVSTDSSLHEVINYERVILRAPEESRLERLKELVAILLTTRTEAFYSERLFSKKEGEEAVRKLALVYELSRAFEIHERI